MLDLSIWVAYPESALGVLQVTMDPESALGVLQVTMEDKSHMDAIIIMICSRWALGCCSFPVLAPAGICDEAGRVERGRQVGTHHENV
jgi:hypothetical protein